MHPDDKDFFSWLIATKESVRERAIEEIVNALDTPNQNSNDRINSGSIQDPDDSGNHTPITSEEGDERCRKCGTVVWPCRARFREERDQAQAILTDLIAELRDIQSATYEQRSSVELVARREETLDALDRAGARLREVGDE